MAMGIYHGTYLVLNCCAIWHCASGSLGDQMIQAQVPLGPCYAAASTLYPMSVGLQERYTLSSEVVRITVMSNGKLTVDRKDLSAIVPASAMLYTINFQHPGSAIDCPAYLGMSEKDGAQRACSYLHKAGSFADPHPNRKHLSALDAAVKDINITLRCVCQRRSSATEHTACWCCGDLSDCQSRLSPAAHTVCHFDGVSDTHCSVIGSWPAGLHIPLAWVLSSTTSTVEVGNSVAAAARAGTNITALTRPYCIVVVCRFCSIPSGCPDVRSIEEELLRMFSFPNNTTHNGGTTPAAVHVAGRGMVQLETLPDVHTDLPVAALRNELQEQLEQRSDKWSSLPVKVLHGMLSMMGVSSSGKKKSELMVSTLLLVCSRGAL